MKNVQLQKQSTVPFPNEIKSDVWITGNWRNTNSKSKNRRALITIEKLVRIIMHLTNSISIVLMLFIDNLTGKTRNLPNFLGSLFELSIKLEFPWHFAFYNPPLYNFILKTFKRDHFGYMN